MPVHRATVGGFVWKSDIRLWPMLRDVDFKMRILSFRLWIAVPLFAVSMTLATLWPAVGRTDVVMAPSTESSAGGVTDAWLVARGLIGSAMISEQSGSDIMTAAAGHRGRRNPANRGPYGRDPEPGQVVERNGRRRHDPYRGDHPIGASVRSRILAVSQSSSGLHHVSMDAVRSWSRATERVLA